MQASHSKSNYAETPHQLAQQIAALVVSAWARAVNHGPRLDRNGKSRAQPFRDAAASPEQIAEARAALLDAAFERLGLDDPQSHFRGLIAAWPLEAVVNGFAVFEGKKKAGTLPEDVDARYLRGIVQDLAEEAEGWHIALALASARRIDRTFWLLATADVIGDEGPTQHRALLRLAARRIHATFAVPHDERLAATRFLFAKVVVID